LKANNLIQHWSWEYRIKQQSWGFGWSILRLGKLRWKKLPDAAIVLTTHTTAYTSATDTANLHQSAKFSKKKELATICSLGKVQQHWECKLLVTWKMFPWVWSERVIQDHCKGLTWVLSLCLHASFGAEPGLFPLSCPQNQQRKQKNRGV
jgi:hypothetical protein